MRRYSLWAAATLVVLGGFSARADDAADAAQETEVAKGLCAAMAAPLFCEDMKTNASEVSDFFKMGNWTAADFSPPKGKFAKICEGQMAYLSSEVKRDKPGACATVFKALNTADVKLLVKK